jgi:hypothetical protein
VIQSPRVVCLHDHVSQIRFLLSRQSTYRRHVRYPVHLGS